MTLALILTVSGLLILLLGFWSGVLFRASPKEVRMAAIRLTVAILTFSPYTAGVGLRSVGIAPEFPPNALAALCIIVAVFIFPSKLPISWGSLRIGGAPPEDGTDDAGGPGSPSAPSSSSPSPSK